MGALVQGILDVNGASPRRYFFEVLHHFATAELELDRLEYFSTPAGRDDLYTYNQKEGVHSQASCSTYLLKQTPLKTCYVPLYGHHRDTLGHARHT